MSYKTNKVMVLICDCAKGVLVDKISESFRLPSAEYDPKFLSVADHALHIATQKLGFKPKRLVLVSPASKHQDYWLFKTVVDGFVDTTKAANKEVICSERYSEIMTKTPRMIDSVTSKELLDYFSFIEETAFEKSVAIIKRIPLDNPLFEGFRINNSYECLKVKRNGATHIRVLLNDKKSVLLSLIVFNRYFCW